MKAVIFGCSGPVLSDEEKAFFERVNPLGFILFERNCMDPSQLKNLVKDLKTCVGRDDLPILIDREGGRISRLNTKFWRTPPSPKVFGDLYEIDADAVYDAVYNNARLMAYDLVEMGLSVNCTPLADVPSFGAHPVISDRAFSHDVDVVTSLCMASIEGTQDMGITPVLKHFPGHGRAMVDSHEDLPVIHTPLRDLVDIDFYAFKAILSMLHETLRPLPWGMTAHIVYKEIDDQAPATFSSKVIDHIIRGHLDFQGFLISDCLTMKALKGSMGERAKHAIEAGCDAILHCNGDLMEMVEVAANVMEINDNSLSSLEESKLTLKSSSIDTLLLEQSIQETLSLENRMTHAQTM